MLFIIIFTISLALRPVYAHSAFWHPSMWGFNVTDKTFDYDNRPVVPIKNMNFDRWWFHNHLNHPPNPGDFFELPAGQPATAEIACNKGATSYFASSEGGDIRDPNKPNDPCPHSPTTAYHTNGFDDLKGCALAITYESDVSKVQPEDFTVFSVNQTCVWTRFTDFQVPARMPPCPPGGCICAFFWIHSEKSGGEENYMNGFRCNVTSSTSTVPLAKPKVPRRCGADPERNRMVSAPANCTFGAKQPLYWFQNERNNMFEGFYSPPFYNDLYNFLDGPQDDIFVDSYVSIPEPGVTAALPVLAGVTVSSGGANANFYDLQVENAATNSSTGASEPSNSPSGTAPASNPKETAVAAVQVRTCQLSRRNLAKRSFQSPPSGFKDKVLFMFHHSRTLHPRKRSQLWNIL